MMKYVQCWKGGADVLFDKSQGGRGESARREGALGAG